MSEKVPIELSWVQYPWQAFVHVKKRNRIFFVNKDSGKSLWAEDYFKKYSVPSNVSRSDFIGTDAGLAFFKQDRYFVVDEADDHEEPMDTTEISKELLNYRETVQDSKHDESSTLDFSYEFSDAFSSICEKKFIALAVFDTSSVIQSIHMLKQCLASSVVCFIPYIVLRELDGLTKSSGSLKKRAIEANIELNKLSTKSVEGLSFENSIDAESSLYLRAYNNELVEFKATVNDEKILKSALNVHQRVEESGGAIDNVFLISEDRNLKTKCRAHNLNVSSIEEFIDLLEANKALKSIDSPRCFNDSGASTSYNDSKLRWNDNSFRAKDLCINDDKSSPSVRSRRDNPRSSSRCDSSYVKNSRSSSNQKESSNIPTALKNREVSKGLNTNHERKNLNSLSKNSGKISKTYPSNKKLADENSSRKRKDATLAFSSASTIKDNKPTKNNKLHSTSNSKKELTPHAVPIAERKEENSQLPQQSTSKLDLSATSADGKRYNLHKRPFMFDSETEKFFFIFKTAVEVAVEEIQKNNAKSKLNLVNKLAQCCHKFLSNNYAHVEFSAIVTLVECLYAECIHLLGANEKINRGTLLREVSEGSSRTDYLDAIRSFILYISTLGWTPENPSYVKKEIST